MQTYEIHEEVCIHILIQSGVDYGRGEETALNGAVKMYCYLVIPAARRTALRRQRTSRQALIQ